LNGTDGPATAGRQTERSGGQKGRGWGEGIFARPRFSAAAEFCASETGAPPTLFSFASSIIK